MDGRGRANTIDTLLNITTDVAEEAVLHESYQENDMVGMRPASPQIIQPDSTLNIKPGGFHIMLINLKNPLAKGDTIRLSLRFLKSGEHQIEVPIKLYP